MRPMFSGIGRPERVNKHKEKITMIKEAIPLDKQAEIKSGKISTENSMTELILGNEKGCTSDRVKDSTKSINSAIERFEMAKKALLESNDIIIAKTKSIVEQNKKACSSVKSLVNETKDQLLKVDSILGDNVEHKINQLERVAEALKTINALSSDEKTMNLVQAMINKN